MAQPYVAGPAQVYIKPFSVYQFLGWSERGVRMSFNPEWDDVQSDLSGSRMPVDVQQMGETATISLDLKIWNATTLATAQARDPFTIRGAIAPGQIGKLMLLEQAAYEVVVRAPYQGAGGIKAAIFGLEPTVWRFYKSWLAGPDDFEPFGTRARRVRCVFRSIPFFIPATGAFSLYDHPTGLVLPPPTYGPNL